MTASTKTFETGVIGSVSRTLHRPRFRAATARRPWRTEEGDQLVLHAPFEHPADPVHPLVDDAAGEVIGDHLVPDGFERDRPEVSNGNVTVRQNERLDGILDVGDLAGGPAVLDVVRLGEPEIA